MVFQGGRDKYGNLIRPYIPGNELEHLRLCNIQESGHRIKINLLIKLENMILDRWKLNSTVQYRSSREAVDMVVDCWDQIPTRRPDKGWKMEL